MSQAIGLQEFDDGWLAMKHYEPQENHISNDVLFLFKGGAIRQGKIIKPEKLLSGLYRAEIVYYGSSRQKLTEENMPLAFHRLPNPPKEIE